MQGDTLAEYAEKVLLIIQYAVVSVRIECIIGAVVQGDRLLVFNDFKCRICTSEIIFPVGQHVESLHVVFFIRNIFIRNMRLRLQVLLTDNSGNI